MTGDLFERRLGLDDVPAAVALSDAANWNQVAADWRLMLGEGWGISLAETDARSASGTVIATALTFPLGPRLAWISMVLVAAERRRRGLGTRLLRRCIDQLAQTRMVAGLDATPAGRPVYERLGFVALHGLTRFGLDCARLAGTRLAAELEVRPLSAADLPALGVWDAARSGTARGAVLAHLQDRLPAAAWVASRDGQIAGYVLGRDGRAALQLGPLVADDEAVARALLGTAAASLGRASLDGPCILDMPDGQAGLGAWLQGLGAATQRGFTRMVLGPADILPPPEPIYAIAGPELG